MKWSNLNIKSVKTIKTSTWRLEVAKTNSSTFFMISILKFMAFRTYYYSDQTHYSTLVDSWWLSMTLDDSWWLLMTLDDSWWLLMTLDELELPEIIKIKDRAQFWICTKFLNHGCSFHANILCTWRQFVGYILSH